MADALEQPERFVKLPEVCRRVGLGKSMIYEMIREGRFPAPYKLSPFASRWSEREIVAWIDEMNDGLDRKSVVLGTCVSVRLALGGVRLFKKKISSNHYL